MQKLLITGGLGFIGSNFVRLLLDTENEIEIINLDLLSYAGNPMNLADIETDERYQLAIGDIADRDLVDSILSEGGFSGIINFAAESMVDRSIISSEPFIHSNVHGTQVLLDMAVKHRIPRFLQVSTDEVYGSLGPNGVFTEDSPIQPNNPYSASKAGADMLCRAYYVTHKLPVLVTRCSNNYGPYQFPEKLIPLMIKKALNDERLPVYGDGLHVRDWLYVTDHCRAIWTVFNDGKAGEVYNIGGGRELPNLELIWLLLDALEKPHSLVEHVEDRPGHDRRYAISYNKLRDELDWNPEVSFEDGIKQTIAWYLNNQEWLNAIIEGKYQQGYGGTDDEWKPVDVPEPGPDSPRFDTSPE